MKCQTQLIILDLKLPMNWGPFGNLTNGNKNQVNLPKNRNFRRTNRNLYAFYIKRDTIEYKEKPNVMEFVKIQQHKFHYIYEGDNNKIN